MHLSVRPLVCLSELYSECYAACAVLSCGLSMLATQPVFPRLTSAKSADSMTLHLGDWLALPAVPLVVSLVVTTFVIAASVILSHNTSAVEILKQSERDEMNGVSVWSGVMDY